MKILFIYDHYFPHIGGAEILYQHVAEAAAKEHSVTVITIWEKGAKEFEVQNNVTIWRMKSFKRILFPFFAFWKALQIAKQSDLIQTSLYSSAVLTWVISILVRIPTILLVHEVIGQNWYNIGIPKVFAWFNKVAEKIAVTRKFSGYVAVSQSTKKQLQDYNIPEKKIEVIYNGIDEKLFSQRQRNNELREKLGITDKQFVYFYSGRPGVTKGIWYLLDACKELYHQNNIRCVLLLSKKPEAEYLKVKNFIRENKLTKHVILLEPVLREDVPSYFAIADVIVVPSLTEGFGFSAAEASSMRIPLIVTNAGSLPEVVSGKVITIEAHSTSAIVEAITKAMKGDFQKIPEKSFIWKEAEKGYLQLYKEITK